MTLYAKWTINQYNVLFDSRGGSLVDPQIVAHNELALEPTAPTKVGHTFDQWYADAQLTTPWDFATDTITQDTTLYAGWDVNIYTVTFESNGGTPIQPISSPYGQQITAPTVPTKVGYQFAGWYQEEGLINVWDFDVDVVEGDMTLYAKWTINQYNVQFDSRGGSLVDPQIVDYNAFALEPTVPTKVGYQFAGWYQEETLINAWRFDVDVVVGNMTLYASWVKQHDDLAVNLYFDLNGGEGIAPSMQALVPGSLAIKPEDPKRTGYEFSGWNTRADGKGDIWYFNKTTMPDQSVTLYAMWQPNQTLPDTGMSSSAFELGVVVIFLGSLVVISTKKRYRKIKSI